MSRWVGLREDQRWGAELAEYLQLLLTKSDHKVTWLQRRAQTR